MRKDVFRKGLVIGIILLFIGASAVSGIGGSLSLVNSKEDGKNRDIIYVNWDGTGDYTTIQEGIDAANPGDTVYVYSGNYYGHVSVNKQLTLIGENKENTVIDGGGSGDVVNISANSVKISGFTIKNSSHVDLMWQGSGIRSIYNENIIENNIITGNYDGIHFGYFDEYTTYHNSDNNTIRGNIISNNLQDGIQSGGYYNTINDNILSDNTCYGIEVGIYGLPSPNVPQHHIYNNLLVRCGLDTYGSGILLSMGSSNNIVENNTIENGTDIGIYIGNYENGCNNIIRRNEVTGSHKGILIFDSDNNTVIENNLSNHYYGIIVLVDESKDNVIYHNNLINNTVNGLDEGTNTWYNSTLQEGNYWDDYTGIDSDGDGIGDTPYPIPGGNNQDSFPFMNPIYWKNYPPNTPTIDGPTNGKAGTSYDYDFTATDPNGDDVKYFIDWDDGNTEWTDFSASGTPVTVSHTWAEEDTYIITAKAQDEYGLESDWATLEVVMPVNQQVVINPLIQMILERFPNAFPVLRYLLGL